MKDLIEHRLEFAQTKFEEILANAQQFAFSGHSFRRGWLTAAARQPNADIFKMAEHSRHKSMDVLKEYIDEAGKLEDHAGEDLL